MGTDAGKLSKHFFIYALGIVLTRAAGFLLIPLYTRYLPTSEFGVLEIINNSTYVINLIFASGLGMTSLYFYASETEQDRKNASISTAIMMLILFGSIALITAISVSKILCTYFLGDSRYLIIFRMASVGILTDMVGMVPMAYLQARMQSKAFVIVSCAQFISVVCLNIIFVTFLGMKLKGIILANLLVSTISALTLSYYTLSQTGVNFDSSLLIKMLSFGLPFVPGGIFQFILNNGDRFFIRAMLDSSILGVYSLGYKIGGLITFFVHAPFLKVWGPYMFELDKSDSERKLFGKIFIYLVFVYCMFGIPLSLFSKELIQFMSGKSYWNAYKVIPYIVLSGLFWILACFFDSGFYIKRKTIYKPFIMGAATILVLILYWIQIPAYGLLGGAYATVISFAALSLLTYIASNRIYPIKYPIGKFTYILGLGVFLQLINITLLERISSLFLIIIIKSVLSVGYPVIMIATGVLNGEDIDMIKNLIMSVKRTAPIQ